MSMTMEQVVTQLQQELFTLRAQVAAESGLADAVRATKKSRDSSVRKDTPSVIDVKALGRPKELTGREEDFQEWSKKTEAFFAGVIKESEMMLEWAAEPATEITTTAIELEFLPTDTTLSPTRGRIRWRHGGDCRSDMIRRHEKETKPSAHDPFSWTVLSSGTPSGGSNAGSPTCLASRRR